VWVKDREAKIELSEWETRMEIAEWEKTMALQGRTTRAGGADSVATRARRTEWLAAMRWRRRIAVALHEAGLTFTQWLVLTAARELIEETRDAVSQKGHVLGSPVLFTPARPSCRRDSSRGDSSRGDSRAKIRCARAFCVRHPACADAEGRRSARPCRHAAARYGRRFRVTG
jgi:hypothetical protein